MHDARLGQDELDLPKCPALCFDRLGREPQQPVGDLIPLRAALDVEMKRRNLAVTVGQIAEQLAIGFFNGTAGRPNLQLAPTGTTNVDALSRRGERYSIKGVLNAKKTGTIYPDAVDREKQLFEFLLVVKVDREWSLEAI